MDDQATVDSDSDARTTNNTDAVRHNYRVLSDAEKAQMVAIKDAGVAFLETLKPVNAIAAREAALARTNLEQAVMWAVKGLTG